MGTEAEDKKRAQDLLNDRMFLAMLLLDPEAAVKSYGLPVPGDDLKKLKILAEGELTHWQSVFSASLRDSTANVCNLCLT